MAIYQVYQEKLINQMIMCRTSKSYLNILTYKLDNKNRYFGFTHFLFRFIPDISKGERQSHNKINM